MFKLKTHSPPNFCNIIEIMHLIWDKDSTEYTWQAMYTLMKSNDGVVCKHTYTTSQLLRV